MTEPREVKVFRASVPDPENLPSIPFELEFTNWAGEVVATHRFDALANPGAGANLAVGSIVRWDSRGKQIIDLNGMMTFFDRVLTPADYSRLSMLIDDKDMLIEMDLLGDVFMWLVEEVTGRPIQRSSSSSGGQRATGAPSMASPSSAG